MAALASELGVTPQALYKHFGSFEELVVFLSDVWASELELPELTDDWRQWLLRFASWLRDGIAALPAFRREVSFRGMNSSSALRVAERTVALMCQAGLSPGEAFSVHVAVATTATYAAVREGDIAEAALDGSDIAAEFAAAVEQRASFLPHLAPLLEEWLRSDRVQQFEFSIELIIAGVERLLAARGSPLGRIDLPTER